jgi:ABC-type Fe3+/spermidine/putrescine transport system ATPase subunit
LLIELIEIQDKLKTTFIYVTHDQLEALTVADQMAIMNHNGEIEQIGAPKDIYEFPVSSFVARFVGTTNILRGILHVDGDKTTIEIPQLGDFEVYIPKLRPWMVEGHKTVMSLRPEKIYITAKPTPDFSNMLQGIVESIVYHGRSTQYNVRVQNQELIQVFQQNEEHFPQEVIDYDSHVYLYWQKENVVLLER